MAKTYTAYSRNIGPDLQKAVPNRVEIGAVTLKIDLTLEDAGYKKVTGSPVWLQKVNETANKIVPTAIAGIAADIKKAPQLNEKTISAIVEKNGEAAATALARAIEAALATWVRDKKEYTSYKVKTAGKIVLGAVGIAASAATAALTAGAASPVAIIGMARSGIALAQNVAKLAMEAEGVERVIRADIVVLTKAFAKNKDSLATQNLKEIGLAGIAAVLGVDTPTIKNCGERIVLYKNKITGLKKDHQEFAKAIYKLMDLQDGLKDKMKKAAKDSNGLAKAEKSLKQAEAALDDVLKRVVGVGERIEKAEDRYKEYSKFIVALQSGVSGWTKYAQIVLSLAISLGSDIATHTSAVEKGLSELQSSLNTVGEEIVEHA